MMKGRSIVTTLAGRVHRAFTREPATGAGRRGRRPLLSTLANLATVTFVALSQLHPPLVTATAAPNADIGVHRSHVIGIGEAASGPVDATATGPAGELAQSPQAAASQLILIHIKSFAFGPATVTVDRGQQVTWVNDDPVPHTATDAAQAWDTGQLQPGSTVSVTFTKTGTYLYNCTVHPFMQAKVVVR